MDIILFGVQGSGKGTQGKILADKYRLTFFEMGQQLRDMIASGTPVGQKVKAIVESGNLVDDDTIMEVVEAFLARAGSAPVLFDGIPRTEVQCDKLLELLRRHGRDAFSVYIKVSEEEATKRLLLRARQDDTEATIRTRIGNYHAQTVPVIKKFRDVDHLIEVDGEQTVAKVADEMVDKVAYLFT